MKILMLIPAVRRLAAERDDATAERDYLRREQVRLIEKLARCEEW